MKTDEGSYPPSPAVESTKNPTPYRWPTKIRYALMATHLSFILSALIQCLVQTQNATLLLVHAAGLLAFLVYIPAAAVISLLRKKSCYDQAGGEVAYLSSQAVVCILSSTSALLISSRILCPSVQPSAYLPDESDPNISINGSDHYPYCTAMRITSIISLVHCVLIIGWMTWIILEVKRRFKGRTSVGFKRSTSALLAGDTPLL